MENRRSRHPISIVFFGALLALSLSGCATQVLLPTAIDYGDSTSKAYLVYARADLFGQIELRHNPWRTGDIVPSDSWRYRSQEISASTNDGYSTILLENMETELVGDTWFNVIAFNTGYHDLQHSPNLPMGSVHITPDVYRNNLEAIAQLVEKHAGVGIWVDTPGLGAPQLPVGTLVVDDVNIPKYNEIAHEVAREHGFYVLSMPDTDHDGSVHFTVVGYQELGRRLADCVSAALNRLETKYCHK